jgi:hypothetical protein
LGLFQACCVNFENAICDLFGKRLSLHPHLNFALQFARVSLAQISETQELAIPANIRSLDVRLNSDLDENDPMACEYKFQVVYTLDSAKKTGANIRFINPESPAGLEIHNILIKTKAADEMYPFKPTSVVHEVKKVVGNFSSHTRQLAWKRHKVRPKNGSKTPDKTDMTYCIYHSAHGDYTYSRAWIDFLVETYQNAEELVILRDGEWAPQSKPNAS